MSRPGDSSHAAGGGPIVRCPGCGEPTAYRLDNPWRPFCSERCKQHDFGAWASEHYRVGSTTPSEDDDGAAASPT